MADLNQDQETVIRNFQSAYRKIQNREATISEKKDRMAELKPQVDEYNSLKDEVKELDKTNNNDRDFVKRSIEFYEESAGIGVGVNELFEN